MSAYKRTEGAGPAPEAHMIDLRQIFSVIRRRWVWVLATMAIILGLTAIAYVRAPRVFMASASLALDRRVDQLVNDSSEPSLTTDSPTVDTGVQVLTSPTLAAEVVDRLGLAARPGFGQPLDGGRVDAALARRRAIGAVQRGLQVQRAGTSYAITVSHSSTDRVMSTAIANAIVDQYVEDQLSGRTGQRTRETDLLRERIVALRADVRNAESAAARFRAATGLIDVQKDSTSTQQEISALNGQLAAAEADRAAMEARRNAVVNSGAGAEAGGSGLIQGLRSQQATLSAQRADLAGRYGPLHPDLARIDRQLADLNNSIRQETGRIRAQANADARVADGRAASIRSSLGRATGGLTAGNNASVQLNDLERNAESARTLYQSLLDRYNKAVAGQGTDKSNAYVIAHALVPGAPISPSLPVYVAGGLIAALLSAAALVLVLELLESGFQSRQEVEQQLGIPVVGMIPDLATVPGVRAAAGDPMGPPDYLVANEGSLFGEAFRSIRTAYQLGQADHSVRVISVSSALPNEGKTTTSISLARSAALAGLRVVLVDCDMRRRASTKSVGGQADAGLIEVLKGAVPLEQALVRDVPSGAWVLPQSAAGATSYDLITSQAMVTLLSRLRADFDLVVLDTAPVLPLAEARALAGMADSVLLVVRWRKTPIRAAKMALELLGRAGARVDGAALTLVNIRQHSRSGHGDEMAYYKQFQNYYAN
ncbi:GumC family protein [Sphingomonas montana]|uniref:GumC family protein n=1 Tax=Sphingomonas montana TaxID=1843236 RepID=UPI0013EA1D4D|nr:AAA family ATPase [Sphingomonas montana]